MHHWLRKCLLGKGVVFWRHLYRYINTGSNDLPFSCREETCTGLEFLDESACDGASCKVCRRRWFSKHSFIRKHFAVVWPLPFFRQEKHAFCSSIHNFPPFIGRHSLEPGTLVDIMSRLTHVAMARTFVSVDILRVVYVSTRSRTLTEERRLPIFWTAAPERSRAVISLSIHLSKFVMDASNFWT